MTWDEVKATARDWFAKNMYFVEIEIDKEAFVNFGSVVISLRPQSKDLFRPDGLSKFQQAGEELASLLGRRVAIQSYVGFSPAKKEE